MEMEPVPNVEEVVDPRTEEDEDADLSLWNRGQ